MKKYKRTKIYKTYT